MDNAEDSGSKTYGQIAYEVGAAWLKQFKSVSFVPWERVTPEERSYWDEIARVLSKTVYEHHFGPVPEPTGSDRVRAQTFDTITEFAHKYYLRSKDIDAPAEALMDFLTGQCSHYSESDDGESRGERCELCGAATPILRTGKSAIQTALEATGVKFDDADADE